MSLNPRIYADAPVLAAFTFDASGSMADRVTEVLEGHKTMLSTLRQSQKCEMGALFVYQTIFAADVRNLNPWFALDSNGNDNVAQLTAGNYQPAGCTAMYDAVYQLVQDVHINLSQVRQAGLRPSARIAVITAGAETCSALVTKHGKAQAEHTIQHEVQELRDREWLETSLVIGFTNSDFTPEMLEDLRKRLGFAQAVPLSHLRSALRRPLYNNRGYPHRPRTSS